MIVIIENNNKPSNTDSFKESIDAMIFYENSDMEDMAESLFFVIRAMSDFQAIYCLIEDLKDRTDSIFNSKIYATLWFRYIDEQDELEWVNQEIINYCKKHPLNILSDALVHWTTDIDFDIPATTRKILIPFYQN